MPHKLPVPPVSFVPTGQSVGSLPATGLTDFPQEPQFLHLSHRYRDGFAKHDQIF